MTKTDNLPHATLQFDLHHAGTLLRFRHPNAPTERYMMTNQFTPVTAYCPGCNWESRFIYNPRKHWDTRTRARFALRLHLKKAHTQPPHIACSNAEAQFPRTKETKHREPLPTR